MVVIFNCLKVLDLMKEKEALEAELKALGQVLESQGCGMEDALVDGEGFPRSDIDVYQVNLSWDEIFICTLNNFAWLGVDIHKFNRFDMLDMTSEAKETT